MTRNVINYSHRKRIFHSNERQINICISCGIVLGVCAMRVLETGTGLDNDEPKIMTDDVCTQKEVSGSLTAEPKISVRQFHFQPFSKVFMSMYK
jgi:hypothetical protein